MRGDAAIIEVGLNEAAMRAVHAQRALLAGRVCRRRAAVRRRRCAVVHWHARDAIDRRAEVR